MRSVEIAVAALLLPCLLCATAAPSSDGQAARAELAPVRMRRSMDSSAPAESMPITYRFADDYPEKDKQIVREGISMWEDNTCLQFEEIRGGKPSFEVLRAYNDAPCSAGGFIGGRTTAITIRDSCNKKNLSVFHEVGHVLGLDHTHNRHDRDKYLIVGKKTADGGVDTSPITGQGEFAKMSEKVNDNYGVPYDYGSIMHYDPFSAEKAAVGGIVMVARDELNAYSMGQRHRISHSDLEIVSRHYKCDEQCKNAALVRCENSGYIDTRTCKSCICPFMFVGDRCEQISGGINLNPADDCGGTYQASEQWNSVSGSFNTWEGRYTVGHIRECFYHFKGLPGKRLQMRFENVSDNFKEDLLNRKIVLFTRGFDVSGLTLVKNAEVFERTYTAETESAVVNPQCDFKGNFTIFYRVVDADADAVSTTTPRASTTTASTTTTTTTPDAPTVSSSTRKACTRTTKCRKHA